jgi:hypothetical protein
MNVFSWLKVYQLTEVLPVQYYQNHTALVYGNHVCRFSVERAISRQYLLYPSVRVNCVRLCFCVCVYVRWVYTKHTYTR